MRSPFRRFSDFFFAPRVATSFGLMRIAWATAALIRFGRQAPLLAWYYGDYGMFPRWMESIYLRQVLRYSVLDLNGETWFVTAVFVALIACLVLMLVGKATRLSTIASVLLAFSFYERNPFPVAGGDTVLRMLALILVIAPGIEALSVDRLQLQWTHWRKTGSLLPPLLMPAWPRRLLLWQSLLTYGMSLWSKLLGEMWRWGTVVGVVLQHAHFSRFYHTPFAGLLSWMTRPLTYATLAFESAWLLLLIPQRWVWDRIPFTRRGRLRRILIASSILLHVSIDFTMIVGIFLWAMLALVLGLLEGEDFAAMRAWVNRRWKGHITVLYDGRCGLCRRSVFGLTVVNSLGRLSFTDLRDTVARAAAAPDLALEDLEREMHVRLPNGRTTSGFFGFRTLAWHIPLLWPIVLGLYVPGVPWIGKKVYARVAARRRRCSHEGCSL